MGRDVERAEADVTPTQADRERVQLAIATAIYGPQFDPFQNPETFSLCEGIADAAIVAWNARAAEATQAAEIARLLREVDRLKADNAAYSAQCKKLADRNRKLAGALGAHPPISVDAGTWWYPEGDTSSDACCHSPHEVVENTVDDMAEGDRRVIVIERALSLPDVYGLIRVFTEAEKEARGDDEPWTLDLYATAEEANAALSAQPNPADAADQYLIRKNGMYYRPNAQGYTSSVADAGRYTLEEAISHSHPNGPEGPRDGMSYEPVPTRDALRARGVA